MTSETIGKSDEEVGSNHSLDIDSDSAVTVEKVLQETFSNDGKDIPSTCVNEGLWHNPRGWAVVLSAFLVNFFCYGMIFQWGNYQQLYLQIFYNQTNTSRISFIGTIASALLFCSGAFVTPLIQKIGYRKTIGIGAVLCPLGLILASFATELWQLYLSQGLLYGIGAGICYAPAIALPSQYFKKNRSFASGKSSSPYDSIVFSGAGIGGLSISPMTDRLINLLGYRNALRIEGAFGFGLLMLATALAFSKSRPGGSHNGTGNPFAFVDVSLLSRDLIAVMIFGVLALIVYIVPLFLAPQYVTFLGHSASDGAHMVSVISGMNSLARIVTGFLGDRLGALNTVLTCSLASGLFSSILWQFSYNYETYTAYCVLFGLTGGVYLSFLPVVIADIVGIENVQRGIGMCFTITLFSNLLGPPATGMLYQTFGWTSAIQFTGGMTLAGTMAILYLRVRRSGGKLFVII